MAKKKRKRGKRPGPPPPPGSTHPPRAEGGVEPSRREEDLPAGTGTDRRQRALERRQRRARRRRVQYVGIGAVLVLALVGLFVFQRVRSGQAVAQYEALSREAAGCADVESVGGLSRDHVSRRVDYDTSPPVGGAHDPRPLSAGTYQEPFSTDPRGQGTIYQAVHSLEHGFVIVWHDPDLGTDELRGLERAVRRERKTILVPYPDLGSREAVALTAWGRLQRCEEADPEVVSEFIDLFREQTAPEANVA